MATAATLPLRAAPGGQESAQGRGRDVMTQRLAPGDRVGIKVFDDDQLTGSYSVDQAGMVTLPIIGELKLAGLSLEESQKALEARLKEGFYTRPLVSIRIDEYRPVYVHGQVKNPGAYPYRVGLTPVGAMVLAGGAPNPLASSLALTADLNAAEERVNVQRQRKQQLEVRVASLEAQRNSQKTIELARLPPDVVGQPGIEQLVAMEQRQLDAELTALDNEVSVLVRQRPQFKAEIEAINIELGAQSKLLTMAQERQNELSTLVAKGLSRRVSMMEPAQQLALAEMSMARLRSAKSRNEIESGALELKILEKQNQFKQRALTQLADAQRNLADASVQLKHATTIRDLRRQSLGPGTLNLAPLFVVTRMTGDEPKVFEATISTPIEPGDIVEVRSPSTRLPEAATNGDELLPKRAEEPSDVKELRKPTLLRKPPSGRGEGRVQQAALGKVHHARPTRTARLDKQVADRRYQHADRQPAKRPVVTALNVR